jgi:site-specific recombinase XerD
MGKKIDIVGRVSLHTLRHSKATILSAQKIDLHTLTRRLGHESIQNNV